MPEGKVSQKLFNMLPAWLLINAQSESAMQNLQTLMRHLDEEAKSKLYEIVKNDLTSRVNNQILMLQEQLDRMEL